MEKSNSLSDHVRGVTLPITSLRLQIYSFVLAEVSSAALLLDPVSRAVLNISSLLMTAWQSIVVAASQQCNAVHERENLRKMFEQLQQEQQQNRSGGKDSHDGTPSVETEQTEAAQQTRNRHQPPPNLLFALMRSIDRRIEEQEVEVGKHVEKVRNIVVRAVLQQFLHVQVLHSENDGLLAPLASPPRERKRPPRHRSRRFRKRLMLPSIPGPSGEGTFVNESAQQQQLSNTQSRATSNTAMDRKQRGKKVIGSRHPRNTPLGVASYNGGGAGSGPLHDTPTEPIRYGIQLMVFMKLAVAMDATVAAVKMITRCLVCIKGLQGYSNEEQPADSRGTPKNSPHSRKMSRFSPTLHDDVAGEPSSAWNRDSSAAREANTHETSNEKHNETATGVGSASIAEEKCGDSLFVKEEDLEELYYVVVANRAVGACAHTVPCFGNLKFMFVNASHGDVAQFYFQQPQTEDLSSPANDAMSDSSATPLQPSPRWSNASHWPNLSPSQLGSEYDESVANTLRSAAELQHSVDSVMSSPRMGVPSPAHPRRSPFSATLKNLSSRTRTPSDVDNNDEHSPLQHDRRAMQRKFKRTVAKQEGCSDLGNDSCAHVHPHSPPPPSLPRQGSSWMESGRSSVADPNASNEGKGNDGERTQEDDEDDVEPETAWVILVSDQCSTRNATHNDDDDGNATIDSLNSRGAFEELHDEEDDDDIDEGEPRRTTEQKSNVLGASGEGRKRTPSPDPSATPREQQEKQRSTPVKDRLISALSDQASRKALAPGYGVPVRRSRTESRDSTAQLLGMNDAGDDTHDTLSSTVPAVHTMLPFDQLILMPPNSGQEMACQTDHSVQREASGADDADGLHGVNAAINEATANEQPNPPRQSLGGQAHSNVALTAEDIGDLAVMEEVNARLQFWIGRGKPCRAYYNPAILSYEKKREQIHLEDAKNWNASTPLDDDLGAEKDKDARPTAEDESDVSPGRGKGGRKGEPQTIAVLPLKLLSVDVGTISFMDSAFLYSNAAAKQFFTAAIMHADEAVVWLVPEHSQHNHRHSDPHRNLACQTKKLNDSDAHRTHKQNRGRSRKHSSDSHPTDFFFSSAAQEHVGVTAHVTWLQGVDRKAPADDELADQLGDDEEESGIGCHSQRNQHCKEEKEEQNWTADSIQAQVEEIRSLGKHAADLLRRKLVSRERHERRSNRMKIEFRLARARTLEVLLVNRREGKCIVRLSLAKLPVTQYPQLFSATYPLLLPHSILNVGTRTSAKAESECIMPHPPPPPAPPSAESHAMPAPRHRTADSEPFQNPLPLAITACTPAVTSAVQLSAFTVTTISAYVAPVWRELHSRYALLVDLDRTLVDNAILFTPPPGCHIVGHAVHQNAKAMEHASSACFSGVLPRSRSAGAYTQEQELLAMKQIKSDLKHTIQKLRSSHSKERHVPQSCVCVGEINVGVAPIVVKLLHCDRMQEVKYVVVADDSNPAVTEEKRAGGQRACNESAEMSSEQRAGHVEPPPMRSEMVFVRPQILRLLSMLRQEWNIPLVLVTKSTSARALAILDGVVDPRKELFPRSEKCIVTAEDIVQHAADASRLTEEEAKGALTESGHCSSDSIFAARKSICHVLESTLDPPVNGVQNRHARSVVALDDAPQVWEEEDWPQVVCISPFTLSRVDPRDYLGDNGLITCEILSVLFSSVGHGRDSKRRASDPSSSSSLFGPVANRTGKRNRMWSENGMECIDDDDGNDDDYYYCDYDHDNDDGENETEESSRDTDFGDGDDDDGEPEKFEGQDQELDGASATDEQMLSMLQSFPPTPKRIEASVDYRDEDVWSHEHGVVEEASSTPRNSTRVESVVSGTASDNDHNEGDDSREHVDHEGQPSGEEEKEEQNESVNNGSIAYASEAVVEEAGDGAYNAASSRWQGDDIEEVVPR